MWNKENSVEKTFVFKNQHICLPVTYGEWLSKYASLSGAAFTEVLTFLSLQSSLITPDVTITKLNS